MPLSDADYEKLAAFRATLRRFLAFSDAAAGKLGLTQAQYQALLAVRASPGAKPLTISDLAATLLVRHHSAVGMVDRLQEMGMVRRESSTADRRKVCVRLTPKGSRVFAKLAVAHRAELRRIGPDMARLMEFFARRSG
jgi:DNA-binding MarR family transcriptional regulator